MINKDNLSLVSEDAHSSVVKDALLAAHEALGVYFRDLGSAFEKEHDAYCSWVRDRLLEVLELDEMKNPLAMLGVDWLTVHYLTRHPRARVGESSPWIQVGKPIKEKMREVADELQVYRNQEPPYFRGQATAGRQRAVVIHFVEDRVDLRESLTLAKEVVSFLSERTRDRQYSDELFVEEDLETVEGIQPGLVDMLRTELRSLVERDLRPLDALELLRNVCRVTLLALRLGKLEIPFPRFIAICPSYVGENIIGGIAYIGNTLLPENALPLLGGYSDILLGRLRLLEEPMREYAIREAQALNLARGNYLQRITHSIQDPLESLWLAASDTIEILEPIKDSIEEGLRTLRGVKDAVERLQKTTGHMMLTFARDNVDELLKGEKREAELADLLSLLRFLYNPAFKKVGKILDIAPVPTQWHLWIDRTAILELLGNLITNGLRYAKSMVWIEVERQEAPVPTYRILVKDDGRGVEPSIVGRLLSTPGVHDPAEDSDQAEPHGFGLYFGAQIANGHGGRLYLEPKTTGGAEFVLEIPEGNSAREGEADAKEKSNSF